MWPETGFGTGDIISLYAHIFPWREKQAIISVLIMQKDDIFIEISKKGSHAVLNF